MSTSRSSKTNNFVKGFWRNIAKIGDHSLLCLHTSVSEVLHESNLLHMPTTETISLANTIQWLTIVRFAVFEMVYVSSIIKFVLTVFILQPQALRPYKPCDHTKLWLCSFTRSFFYTKQSGRGSTSNSDHPQPTKIYNDFALINYLCGTCTCVPTLQRMMPSQWLARVVELIRTNCPNKY